MSKENWDDVTEVNASSDEAWDNRAPLIGKYISTKEDVGPNQSKMHNIKTDEGEVVGAWGSTVLDNKMSEVEIGSRVRIEFLGLVKNPKTNREYKDYSVKAKAPEIEVPKDVLDSFGG